MDFEEFREKLMEDLAQDLYENTGAEYSIEATSINKLQNAGYEGIVIRPEDSAVGINLDAESLYKSYNDGKPYEEVFDEAYRMIADGFENQPEFNVEDFSNYDVMKEKLAIQVVSTERNTEMLEKIPHKEVEDMSLVCRFIVGDSKFGQGSILVNNDMLENYGITKEQLFEDAAKTVGINSQTAKINSLAQLSSDDVGHLVVVKAESMSKEYSDGESCIAELVATILNDIHNPVVENDFLIKLGSFGVDITDECFLEKFKVKQDGIKMYSVDNHFPRITERNITFSEIVSAVYELSLSAIEKYREE